MPPVDPTTHTVECAADGCTVRREVTVQNARLHERFADTWAYHLDVRVKDSKALDSKRVTLRLRGWCPLHSGTRIPYMRTVRYRKMRKLTDPKPEPEQSPDWR